MVFPRLGLSIDVGRWLLLVLRSRCVYVASTLPPCCAQALPFLSVLVQFAYAQLSQDSRHFLGCSSLLRRGTVRTSPAVVRCRIGARQASVAYRPCDRVVSAHVVGALFECVGKVARGNAAFASCRNGFIEIAAELGPRRFLLGHVGRFLRCVPETSGRGLERGGSIASACAKPLPKSMSCICIRCANA